MTHSIKAGSTAPSGKRCAIYCRVSTANQEDNSSLQTQESECRDYARQHDLVIDEGHIYKEVYSGAELWDRPKLSLLRHAIRSGAVQQVICYAIDRMSRDPVHLGVIVSEADFVGVEITFVSEPLDDSPEGQLIRFVRGYAAKVEHAKIRERSLRGKRARVLSGKIHSSAVELYGYRRDKERGIRIVCESEAETIRQIFHWSFDGMPIRTIARRLNDEGVQPPSVGKINYGEGRTPRWGHSVIYRILKELAYKGETYVWRFKHVSKLKGGIHRSEDEWIKLPEGTSPAIIDVGLWDAVNRRLNDHKGENARNETRPHLLRGLIYCSICGQRMYSSPEHAKTVYRCSSRERVSGACGGKRVPGEKVEQYVWAQVEDLIKQPELIEAEIDNRRRLGPNASMVADRDAAKQRFSKVEREQLKALRDFRELENIAPSLMDGMKRELGALEREKTQLAIEIAELEHRLAKEHAQLNQIVDVAAYFATVQGNLDSTTFETKRLALSALDVRVIANGSDSSDWSITGSIPFKDEVDGVVTHTQERYVHPLLRLPTRV